MAFTKEALDEILKGYKGEAGHSTYFYLFTVL